MILRLMQPRRSEPRMKQGRTTSAPIRTMTAPPLHQKIPLTIRLDKWLHDKLEAAAGEKSKNDYITAVLLAHLDAPIAHLDRTNSAPTTAPPEILKELEMKDKIIHVLEGKMTDDEVLDHLTAIEAQYKAEEANPYNIADRESDLHERGMDWMIEMEREMREEYYLGKYPSNILLYEEADMILQNRRANNKKENM